MLITNCTFQNHWLLKTISLLISCHVDISFIIENIENNKILFSDMNIIRRKGQFTTTIYRKTTFSIAYATFDNTCKIHIKLTYY